MKQGAGGGGQGDVRRLAEQKVRRLQRKLLTWYRRHGRHDFIWRKTPTPYRVLVAEVMLQQTQVSRVEPKYRAFLRRYPNFKTLAEAQTGELLQRWSGLGYNRRALLLKRCAQQVVQRHRGRLPTEHRQLRQLAGIGPYTAAAINVFARNRDEVCVDTNVRRVLIHELKLPHRLSHRQLETVARLVLPRGRSREWHSALMDYGRMVATSRATGVKPPNRSPGKFIGSRRYWRGRVVRLLVRERRLPLRRLARQLGLPMAAVVPLVGRLADDGLVVLRRNDVRLPR